MEHMKYTTVVGDSLFFKPIPLAFKTFYTHTSKYLGPYAIITCNLTLFSMRI